MTRQRAAGRFKAGDMVWYRIDRSRHQIRDRGPKPRSRYEQLYGTVFPEWNPGTVACQRRDGTVLIEDRYGTERERDPMDVRPRIHEPAWTPWVRRRKAR